MLCMKNTPSNRQLKKLWEICKFQNWFTFKSELFREKWEPILRISNIQNNWFSDDKLVFFDVNDYDNLDNYIVYPWELVIAMSWATTWKLAINNKNKNYYLNQRVGKFIFKEDVTKKYCHYFLWTKIEENLHKSSWSAIPNLSTKQILEIQIPLPPLEEQKKIVAYLDELNATISKLKSEYQSQLAMLDEMRNSSLDLAFWGSRERERERAYNLNNWKWVKLAEVCEKITDGTHQTPTYFDSWFVFLSSKNVTSGKIDWDNIKYIDEKQHIEMQKRIAPKKWDILLAKNWTTGIAAIVDRDIIFDIYVSLALLRPQKNIIDNKYLLYFVNSPSAKQQFNKRIKWVGVPNLHLKEIKDVELPLPDLETQSQIVAHLDQVHQQITMLKTQVNSQIEHCDELWQSSLEKVLTQGVNNEFN